MPENETLVPWSWWMPAAGPITSHRGTHRGPTATRAANHIKDYMKIDPQASTLSFEPHGASDVTTVIRTDTKVPHHKPVYLFEVHVISAQAATPSSKIGVLSFLYEYPSSTLQSTTMLVYRAVGVQFNESILSRLPGADRNSLGIHHDTGLLHSDSSEGTPFFQYGPGDTLTVAINFVTDSILLFKNGLSRGAALVGLPGGGAIYPVVGFDHAEASISVNLGQMPFRYPAVLEALTAEAREHVLRAIHSTPPLLLDGTSKTGAAAAPANDNKRKKGARKREEQGDDKETGEKSGAGKGVLGRDGKLIPAEAGGAAAVATQAASAAHTAQLRAILDHLVHASCWKSAEAVSKIISRRTVPLHCDVQPEGTLEAKIGGIAEVQHVVGSSRAPMEVEDELSSSISKETLAEMQQRHTIMELMIAGRIEEAVQEAEKLVAGVLDDEPKVKFEVRLQQFLEMLASEPTTDKQLEAMNFARNTLNPCAKDCPGPDQEAMLSEALVLLAYNKPSSSPTAHFLSPERRQRSASVLNGALMKRSSGHRRSGLDRLCRQLVAVHQEMASSGVLAAGALDLREVLSQSHTS